MLDNYWLLSSWRDKMIRCSMVSPPRLCSCLACHEVLRICQTSHAHSRQSLLLHSNTCSEGKKKKSILYVQSSSLAQCQYFCFSLTPQSDCQIHLQSQVTAPQLEEYLSSIHMHPQSSSQLNKFRIYLCMARQLDYNISDEMTKVRRAAIFSLSPVAHT